MKKIAHKKNDREQSMLEHLKGTAQYMQKFTMHYQITGAQEYAYATGLLHDIGKYSQAFQRKLKENSEIRVDHSTAGAIEAKEARMVSAAFCISGHHAGLPNGKDNTDSCLQERVKKAKEIEDYSGFREDITDFISVKEPELKGFSRAFFVRMLFSALVDADFLDTERFMNEQKTERGEYDSVEILYNALLLKIEPWLRAENEENINKIRTDILKQCLSTAEERQGLYSLTVPTGGGKTVSSFAFALKHAVKNGMKRIIYVIPYTSIIEQNAEVFRDKLGDKLGEKNVVEHYANAMQNIDDEKNKYAFLHKLSTENWDAPIIVTTSVQFFESLFSNRTSECRKLHNIANSIIIFDEAQMIPLDVLRPCVKAIEELVCNYHVTAVLCTATQPALEKWFEKLTIREICHNVEENFLKLKRTEIETLGIIKNEELIFKIEEADQVLVIVNKRKTAQELYRNLSEKGVYHLSTYMTPVNRKRVLERIRAALKNGEKVKVISTSLIEAGVDVDFPIVFREFAGIDSIVQAAGRCNREGKRERWESKVVVFEILEEKQRFLEKNIGMTRETVDKFGEYDSLGAIHYYFRGLQLLDEEYLDQNNIIKGFERDLDGIVMPFREVAERFRMIDEDTRVVIIPLEAEAQELLQELEYRKKEGYNFCTVLRRLGQYAINMRSMEYRKFLENGAVYECLEGVGVLQVLTMYDENMGFCGEDAVLLF